MNSKNFSKDFALGKRLKTYGEGTHNLYSLTHRENREKFALLEVKI